MGFATIQLTQGAIVGGSGESIAGLDTSTAIALTDDGGAGATSYLWECISFPGPDATAPIITNPALQIATITPGGGGLTDGMYVIRLTRDDPGDGVSTDVRFFAVENSDGHSLPSAAVNRNMANVGGSAAAQAAGWFGREDGSTNFFLDAFLRLRKDREGRYFGAANASSHTSGSTTTVLYTYNQADPYQEINLDATGTGEYRADLDLADAEDGSVFRFRVTYDTLAGNFVVRDGSGGSTLLTLTAPPNGSIIYEIMAKFDGVGWAILHVSLVEPLAVFKNVVFDVVNGVEGNATATFARVGSVRIDPSLYPANTRIKFQALIETTVNSVECRLWNVTDGGLVASSTLTSASTTVDFQEAIITLPSSAKVYEVQLRITPVGGGGDQATCTNAQVLLEWA